jgi:PST family polysaccharide transporter
MPKKHKLIFILTVLSILTSVVTYSLTIYLARYLGPNVFGQYSYVLAIYGLVSIFTLFSTEQTSPSLVARGFVFSELFTTVLIIRVLFYVLTSCIVFFVEDDNVLVFGVIALNLSSLGLAHIFEVRSWNIKFSIIYLLEKIVYVLLVGILLLNNSLTLLSVFKIYFLVAFVSLVVQILFNMDLINLNKFGSVKLLKTIFKENSKLIIISLSMFVYGGISKFIVEQKFGYEQLGIFSSGMQFLVLVNLYLAQIEKVHRLSLFKTIQSKDKILFIGISKSWLMYSLLPIAFFGCLLYFLSGFIVDVLFGAEYFELKNIIPLIVIMFVTVTLNNFIMNLWVGLNRLNEFLIISIFFSVTLIGLLYSDLYELNLINFIIIIIIIQTLYILMSLFRMLKIIKLHFK